MNNLQAQESAEYSVISLDSLNNDCLLAIFQHLPLLDLLRLRYQSRSLNNAVCQHLREVRKLQIFLNVDDKYREENGPIFKKLDPKGLDDVTFLADQSHFRLEEFIYLNSFVPRCSRSGPDMHMLDRKCSSLVLFLANHMTNLTELALLVVDENYFRWIPYLLAPLLKLKVFLIDIPLTSPIPYTPTPIVDAISGLPELEELYYLPSDSAHFVLFPMNSSKYDPANQLQVLSNGENFLVTMLRRLRVLHTCGLTFPNDMSFNGLEELKFLDGQFIDDVLQNRFPGVKKMFVRGDEFLGGLVEFPLEPCQFVNLRVLSIKDELDLSDEEDRQVMAGLNTLPNLAELHCLTVLPIDFDDLSEANHSIVRLYTKYYNDYGSGFGGYNIYRAETEWKSITGQQMNEYGAFCKQIFRGLRMFTNELPKQVFEFEPVRGDNRLSNH